ncbi:MAG: PAS domain-containing protein [Phyllobacteriaceae bacterium]|nr:PAS domain-containing protein [Phyllobacteriaceae bacterium]
MRQAGTIELYQYWNRLRRGRPAPARAEIEPADIRTLLADTFILEMDTRGNAIFRLAGTRLCATFGRELRGFAFLSLWRERDQRAIGRLVKGVVADKSIVVVAFEGATAKNRFTAFELALFPLDGGVDYPRLLGAVFAEDKPFWLGAEPLVELRIGSLRVIDPDRDHVFLDNRPAVEVPALAPFALHVAPAGTPRAQRKVRHLVVLDGGKCD